MMLVVINHVFNYVYGYNEVQLANSYSYYFSLFRMPLFFFVAGFVLYKKDMTWNLTTSLKFLRKKTTVQIISPLLFYIAYIIVKNVDIQSSLLSVNKSGYWFTFALFEYFILYILFQTIIRYVNIRDKFKDILLVIYGFTVIIAPYAYKFLFAGDGNSLLEITLAVIGIENFRLFIFFVMGVLIRKHFDKFEYLLDNTRLIIYCLTTFIVVNIAIPDLNETTKMLQIVLKLVLGVCGIVVVFSLFRRYKNNLGSDRLVGRVMQFIGRRTLDIYLLHFFFLHTGLRSHLNVMSEMNTPLLDFSLAILIAAIVVIACLAVSSVLRIHPGMAHFLFGTKKN